MHWTDKEWALWGKLLLGLWAVACLSSAATSLALLTKVWLISAGILSLLVSLRGLLKS